MSKDTAENARTQANALAIAQGLSALLTLIDRTSVTAKRLSDRLQEAHANPDDPSKQVTREEVQAAREETNRLFAEVDANLDAAIGN